MLNNNKKRIYHSTSHNRYSSVLAIDDFFDDIYEINTIKRTLKSVYHRESLLNNPQINGNFLALVREYTNNYVFYKDKFRIRELLKKKRDFFDKDSNSNIRVRIKCKDNLYRWVQFAIRPDKKQGKKRNHNRRC